MINAGPPKGIEIIGKFVKNRISEVSQDKYARLKHIFKIIVMLHKDILQ